MKRFALGVAVGCLSLWSVMPSALAQQQIPNPTGQWTAVAETEGKDVLYVNSAVARQGYTVGFWQQTFTSKGKQYAHYLIANCGNKAYQYLWEAELNAAGRTVSSHQINESSRAEPGTAIFHTVNYACSSNVVSDPVAAHLEALQRARETNAEAIGNAMRTAAEMFK